MAGDVNKLLTEIAYGERDELINKFDGVDCSFVDEKGQNALFPAIAKKRGLTTFFLDRGADANQQNIDGNTPLHIAAANMDKDSCRILFERGADPAIENKYGNQPLSRMVDGDNGTELTSNVMLK